MSNNNRCCQGTPNNNNNSRRGEKDRRRGLTVLNSPFDAENRDDFLVKDLESLKIEIVRKKEDDEEEDSEFDYLLKILIIGDSNVGKSSLLCRVVHNDFDLNHYATIGVDFKIMTVQVNDKYKIRLQFWDTSGQERFHSITKSYFRGSDACILVYDVTDLQSFENVKRWNQHFDENTDVDVKFFPRILVGNKKDQHERRRISEEDGQRLAKDLSSAKVGKMEFWECSAKTGENVEEKFLTIIKNTILNMSSSRRSTVVK